MMNSKIKSALVVLCLAACTEKKPDQVIGKVVTQDLVQSVTVAGSVVPARQTDIQSAYAGFVRKLYVKLGDRVKKDDPLVSVSQALGSSEAAYPLRAPYDGVVVHIHKREGESVSTSSSSSGSGMTILRLDDTSKFFVATDLPETEMTKLRVGLEATVRVSSLPGKTYQAVIREISLAPKDQDRWNRGQIEFPARVEIVNSDNELRSGLSVMIDIVAAKKESVTGIRHEFVQNEGDKYFVMMKDGERREIKLGMRNTEIFEVLDGLKPGEEVRQVDFLALVQDKQ